VAKKSCRDVGAQAGQTIWLYEDWWKAPSLRSSKGKKLQKSYGAGIVDALLEAFMQTQEGILFHEVSLVCHGVFSPLNAFFQMVHLASRGQMRRLLSLAYPRSRLPPTLWNGEDVIGDSTFHQFANERIFVRLVLIRQ
jgi:hypothetical protein